MNIENKLARDQIATCFDLLLEHFEKSIGNVERRTRERVNYPGTPAPSQMPMKPLV